MNKYPFGIISMDLRPYFGYDSETWPDGEEQFFASSSPADKAKADMVKKMVDEFSKYF